MAPVRKRKPMNRKRYVKSEKAKKRRAKQSTEEDMNQNFRIKEVEKKVTQLTKGTRNFLKVQSASTSINTVVGVGKNNNMTQNNHAVDLNRLIITDGVVGGYSGNTAIWKHIDLAYYINQNADADSAEIGTGTVVRVMLICIHTPGPSSIEDNAPLPNWAQIFADNDADATAMVSADILRPYNRLNRQNIEVLYDKFHRLNPVYVSSGALTFAGGSNLIQTQPVRVQLFPSKRSQEQTFNNYDEAPLGDYTQVQKNQYWLIHMTDNADNTVAPTITYNVTVDYLM